MNSSIPAALASSSAYWIKGLSTTGSISFGIDLVAGRKRVPRPATGNTALWILLLIKPPVPGEAAGLKGPGSLASGCATSLQPVRTETTLPQSDPDVPDGSHAASAASIYRNCFQA